LLKLYVTFSFLFLIFLFRKYEDEHLVQKELQNNFQQHQVHLFFLKDLSSQNKVLPFQSTPAEGLEQTLYDFQIAKLCMLQWYNDRSYAVGVRFHLQVYFFLL